MRMSAWTKLIFVSFEPSADERFGSRWWCILCGGRCLVFLSHYLWRCSCLVQEPSCLDASFGFYLGVSSFLCPLRVCSAVGHITDAISHPC